MLCDRFVDSSRAYQGGGGGITDADLLTLHGFGSMGLLPDRTFLLTVSADEAARRLTERGGSDRMGNKPADYQTRLAARFVEMAKAEPARWRIVDADAAAMMIGHQDAEKAFLEAWQGGRLHHAWLLAGPQGMGKGLFAERVARFLVTHGRGGDGQSVTLDDRGDDAAARLVDAGNHPEILRLARQPKDKAKELARNITIEQVRQMIRRLHLSLSLGEWRVIIVDAVDDLETDGANALLKTLEEPPAKTLFLLVSHSPGRLLPTIRSRCRTLRFQPVERDVMTPWLHELRPMLEMAEVRAIVAASGGVPGKALALIDSDVAVMEKKLLAIATSGDPENRLREALAREVGGTSNRARLELVIDIVPGLLARLARERPVTEIAPILAQWDRVQRTVRDAIRGSYDGAMVGFEIGNCLAELAPRTK